MKKIDLHMHVMTTMNLPKIGKVNLSGPEKMIAHMKELGIERLFSCPVVKKRYHLVKIAFAVKL